MAVNFSVIIPSKTASNLIPCMKAVWKHEPGAPILIVDDANGAAADKAADEFGSVSAVCGIKPFIFARNVNLGIQQCGRNDVILLNDDCLLQSTGGFSLLARTAKENPQLGIISAACNSTGNQNQRPRGVGLRNERRILCFTCVYIPRSTIDAVGLLDERFGGIDSKGRQVYGFEDDDYCYRTRLAGLKLAVHDGCVCDHTSLKSTFRSNGHCSLEPGRDLFIQKWGKYPL